MMSKLLLVTGFGPDTQYGGGAIVRSLVGRFDPQDIGWFCLSNPKRTLPAQLKRLIVGYYVFHPIGNQRLRLGRFWDVYYHRIWIKHAAKRIASILLEYDINALWIVLDYHVVPVAAELLKRRPTCRLHFSIHDDPTQMARWHVKSPSLRVSIENSFKAIQKSDCTVDAVSEELLAAVGFSDHPKTIVTLGCEPERCADKIRPGERTGPLRIGYAGSYLSGEQASSLINGLRQWSLQSGREWEFHCFGDKMNHEMPPEVKWRGFIAPDTLSEELAQMSFLLLALENNSPMSITSLPTKLVSYLEVGRLILAMVPNASASARIIRKASLGPVISDLDPNSIASAITCALKWNITVADEGRKNLLQDRFCSKAIFRRFANLVAQNTSTHV
jgi:hypothetical protein